MMWPEVAARARFPNSGVEPSSDTLEGRHNEMGMDPRTRFASQLGELRAQAGNPSLVELASCAPMVLKKSSLSSLLRGEFVRPPRWEVVSAFVGACRRLGADHDGNIPRGLADLTAPQLWRDRHRVLVDALDARDNAERVLARSETLGTQDRASNTTGWRGPVRAVPPLRGDEVARPALMEQLVEAVTRPGENTVGMTTGLWGSGGFGKTTMARLLVHQQAVMENFPDGMIWATLGDDLGGPELAEKISNMVGSLCGDRPTLTDPLAAGAELGRALGSRRVLLVVDDVWSAAQVEPLVIGGPGAMRLFTTRIRGVLPSWAEPIRVDQMGCSEAEELLTAGVAGVSSEVVKGLLAVTGRWPVLLALVNGAVRADQSAGRLAEDSMREILYELRATGPTVLDVADGDDRHTAVTRTIGVSLNRLTSEQRDRYMELAVFGKDVVIPGSVLSRYWSSTGGWSSFQTVRFCQRLAELALVSDYRRDPDRVVLHDVIRAYLREQTLERHGELGRALINAHRSLVRDEDGTSAWWRLPMEQDYLWSRLPTHLCDAGLNHELRACLHHPDWLLRKLEYVGPAGLEGDLALADDPLSQTLKIAVRQNAHLLGPLNPPGSLAATLAARLIGDDRTTAVAEQLLTHLTGPYLRAITTPPDLPFPALSRVLNTPRGVEALAVAPDGSWLAVGDSYDWYQDGQVRIWDPATGAVLHTLTGHPERVTLLAVAPDGAWLASATSRDWDRRGDVKIWNPKTGLIQHTLAGPDSGVHAMAVAPDGSWLAAGNGQGEVRIWDPATGAVLFTLTGHTGRVGALAVAPDGSWLASSGFGHLQIWDPTIGVLRHTLTVDRDSARALVVAPDGTWLAAAGEDGQIRIWNPVTGLLQRTLAGHPKGSGVGGVLALVVAPDGSWLASAGYDNEVRIWDPTTSIVRHVLTGHTSSVWALAVAPDGSWLASAGHDRQVRIWNPIAGTVRHTFPTAHIGLVSVLVVAPDGSWLASAGHDRQVRLWDPSSRPRHDTSTLNGQTRIVQELAMAPNGSWAATADDDGQVRIWDTATGLVQRTLPALTNWSTVLAVAPDGSWLATTSDDDQLVCVWDPETGAVLHTLTPAHTGRVRALAVAPDGSWLAAGTDDGSDRNGAVQIWDLATGAVLHTLIGHTGAVRALAVAPDGSWLASGSSQSYKYGEVRIWDLATGVLRHTLGGYVRSIVALAIAPNGSWLAAAGYEFDNGEWGELHNSYGELQTWDPVTGVPNHTRIDFPDRVSALAVAPDGSWLASASSDNEVRIWDPGDGVMLRPLIGHTGAVQDLAVSPDGSWLASAGDDGQIRIWDPRTGKALTSLRVASGLSRLRAVSTTLTSARIVASGARGVYFLELSRNLHVG